MTRKDFNALADDLVARGYRKYPSIREADYAYYKSFGKSEVQLMEMEIIGKLFLGAFVI